MLRFGYSIIVKSGSRSDLSKNGCSGAYKRKYTNQPSSPEVYIQLDSNCAFAL